VKKAFTIIQIAIVGGIVVYGTVCLFRGDFEGAYATFPFLLFYYVWFVAKRRRKNLAEGEDQ